MRFYPLPLELRRMRGTIKLPRDRYEMATVAEMAAKWQLSTRRVRQLCLHHKVYGAKKLADGQWMIPSCVEKPQDGRAYRHYSIPANLKPLILRADEVLKSAALTAPPVDFDERWLYFLKGSAHHLHTVKKSRLFRRDVFRLVDAYPNFTPRTRHEHAVFNHCLALEFVRDAARAHRRLSLNLIKQIWCILRFGDLGPHRVRYRPPAGEATLRRVLLAVKNRSSHPLVRAGDALNEMFLLHPFAGNSVRTGYMLANFILMSSGYPPVIINRIIFATVRRHLRNHLLVKAHKPQAYEPDIRHAFVNACLINALHYSARLHLPTFI